MAPKTIFLKSGREGEPIPKEGKAEAATIYPGHLVKYASTEGNIVIHSTAGGVAAPMFATEDSMQGQEIGDNYAINTRVQFICAGPGDEVYAWLAQGENAVIGSPLESGADGQLQVADAEASDLSYQIPIAISLEALDLSTSAKSATRIKIMIL